MTIITDDGEGRARPIQPNNVAILDGNFDGYQHAPGYFQMEKNLTRNRRGQNILVRKEVAGEEMSLYLRCCFSNKDKMARLC